jgi:hypothetical protein
MHDLNAALKSFRRQRLSSSLGKRWLETAREEGNLRVVVQQSIANKGTATVLEKARALNNLDVARRDCGDFAPDCTNAARTQAFYTIPGTDNIRPVEYILMDRHQHLRDKEVLKILTYPPGYGGGNQSFCWNVAVLVGKQDN